MCCTDMYLIRFPPNLAEFFMFLWISQIYLNFAAPWPCRISETLYILYRSACQVSQLCCESHNFTTFLMLSHIGNWFLMLSWKVKLQKYFGAARLVFKLLISIDSQLNPKVACRTGALWAKQDECCILRKTQDEHESRDKQRRKIKRLFPVHWSGSSHVHNMKIAFQYWLIDAALFCRDSGMLVWRPGIMQSCSFDDAVRESFHLVPNVSEIKEKEKKYLNLLLKRKDILGLLPSGFGNSLTH